MKIVVLGLGYVGSVMTACLLRDGHTVVGFDIAPHALEAIADGRSPIQEQQVGALLAAGNAAGRLSVTTDLADHADADIAMVCVGTPGLADGALDLSAVKDAAHRLGAAVRSRDSARGPMLLVFRSTMLPGSMAGTVLPAIQSLSGEAPGARYEPVYNPEFIRLGSAVADYFAPTRIVVGERIPGSAQALSGIYASIDAPVFQTTFEVAELAKYADNAFHALKVTFANEIGRVATRSGIRPAEVFDLFLADHASNLSGRYLRPGGAFGGPCLPKDLRALETYAKGLGLAAPVLSHVLASNRAHGDFLLAEVMRRVPPAQAATARILLIGLSFKAGSGDTTESALLCLFEALLDRGYDIAAYDPDLACAQHGRSGNLSARAAQSILPSVPHSTPWDLVIVGKHDAAALAAAGAAPRFHIDRL